MNSTTPSGSSGKQGLGRLHTRVQLCLRPISHPEEQHLDQNKLPTVTIVLFGRLAAITEFIPNWKALACLKSELIVTLLHIHQQIWCRACCRAVANICISSQLLSLLVKKRRSGTSASTGEMFHFPNSTLTDAPFTFYANFLTWETH